MDDSTYKETVLPTLSCASKTIENSHICKDPIELGCKHYICRSCLPNPTNNMYIIRCNICQKINKFDTNQPLKSDNSFHLLFSTHLDNVFTSLFEDFKEKLENCREVILNFEETLDKKIQFIKDQIEIRIESIIVELERMNKSLNVELDRIKTDWIEFNAKRFDIEDMTKQLENIETDISNKNNQTQETFYEYQSKLQALSLHLNQYEANAPDVKFYTNSDSIESTLLGEIFYTYGDEYDHQKIKKHAKSIRGKHIDLENNRRACDICILPNSQLLLTDYNYARLYLYDSRNLKCIKPISSINNSVYKINNLTTNKRDAIYFSVLVENLVIKTDLQFNQLAIFAGGKNNHNELEKPYGICYSRGSVYVCNYGNFGVLKLSDNLEFQQSFTLGYGTMDIKIIKDVACIREFGSAIHFHDVKTFNEIRSYDGTNGVIGASKLYFYEYVHKKGTINCYNSDGMFVEQIQTQFFADTSSDGSIVKIDSKLYICSKASDLIII